MKANLSIILNMYVQIYAAFTSTFARIKLILFKVRWQAQTFYFNHFYLTNQTAYNGIDLILFSKPKFFDENLMPKLQ